MEETDHSLQNLCSYLPASVVKFITQQDRSIEPPLKHDLEAAVLFIDVSGFSALTEYLEELPNGVELLARHLNSYFEQLLRIIGSEGGDVIQFAGDALLVMWPVIDKDIEMSCRRATQAALEIQKHMHRAELEKGVVLSVKMGIGAGKVGIAHVGGVLGRLEYLLLGDPLIQSFKAEAQVSPGKVAVSLNVWKYVADYFLGEVLEGHVVVSVDPTKKSLRRVNISTALCLKKELVNERISEMARKYVPGAIIPFLADREERWASELRYVSVVFINLNLSLLGQDIQQMQLVLTIAQKHVYQFEGSLNKFLVDDKGATLVAVFGLFPVAHEDDPLRALLSAQQIHKELASLNICSSIGVTTGKAFCGVVGSRVRREFSVLGDIVNLSARLMQIANGTVYCDYSTFASTKEKYSLEELPSVHVKGKRALVRIFRPKGYEIENIVIIPDAIQPSRQIIRVVLPLGYGRISFLVDIVYSLYELKQKTLSRLSQRVGALQRSLLSKEFTFISNDLDLSEFDHIPLSLVCNFLLWTGISSPIEISLQVKEGNPAVLTTNARLACGKQCIRFADEFTKGHPSNILLLEGESGVGKTYLCEMLFPNSLQTHVPSCAPDSVWQVLVNQLSARNSPIDSLDSLELEEGVDGEESDRTVQFLIQSLEKAVIDGECAILRIEGGQNLHEKGWEIINRLSSIKRLLIIVTYQPMLSIFRGPYSGHIPASFEKVREKSAHLSLSCMDRHQLSELIGPGIDSSTIEFILWQSRGIPGIAKQIFQALGDDFEIGSIPDRLRNCLSSQMDRLPHRMYRQLQITALKGNQQDSSLMDLEMQRELETLGLITLRNCVVEFRIPLLREVILDRMLDSQKLVSYNGDSSSNKFPSEGSNVLKTGSMMVKKERHILGDDWKSRNIHIKSHSLTMYHEEGREISTVWFEGASICREGDELLLTVSKWEYKGEVGAHERTFSFLADNAVHGRNFLFLVGLLIRHPFLPPDLDWTRFELAAETTAVSKPLKESLQRFSHRGSNRQTTVCSDDTNTGGGKPFFPRESRKPIRSRSVLDTIPKLEQEHTQRLVERSLEFARQIGYSELEDLLSCLHELSTLSPVTSVAFIAIPCKRDREKTYQIILREKWNWNVFLHSEIECAGIAVSILESHSSALSIETDSLVNLVQRVYQKYHQNPFHNFRHAVEALQSTVLVVDEWKHDFVWSEFEIFAVLVAALCHDVDHPGKTNAQLVKECDVLSVLYNNKSVLESHHACVAWQIISKCKLLESFRDEQVQRFRQILVDSILNTDISLHSQVISREKCLEITLHVADISNPCRPWIVNSKWTDCLIQELALQGTESNPSPFALFFINNYVRPTFSKFFGADSILVRTMETNADIWANI